MLRLEEVQFINWGPLRPDTVPFMTRSINLITGTNGSAKTCFVNGIKVLLGVSLPKGSEAREWIFNPLALADIKDAGAPADQALLRGTFCNPMAPGGHRFFSWEGSEFEVEEHATVVCVVRRDATIRYRILPGRVRWEEPLSRTIPRFLEDNPLGGQKWKGPRQYDSSLSRMGVSQAMRGVLALPQGETGEILNETPAGLLRKILQLTGKQEIIDAYAEERKKFEVAETKYRDTSKNLELEKATYETRKREAEKYDEWLEYRQEFEQLRDVLIPAARYRDATRERDLRGRELEGLQETIGTKGKELAAMQKALPELRSELESRERELAELRRSRDSAGRRLRRLDGVLGRLEARAAAAENELQRAEALVAGRTTEELGHARAIAHAEWARSSRALEALEQEIAQLEAEAETLRAGQASAPAAVRSFRQSLAEAGIESQLLADVLEPAGSPVRQIEAALGDAVWALVVSATDFTRAVLAARDADYGYPIARAGSGSPVAVLAGARGPDQLRALLADLDVTAAPAIEQRTGRTGAGTDGFFHLPSLAQLRAPASPRIGGEARAARLAAIDHRLPTAGQERHALAPVVDAAAVRLRDLDEALRLQPGLDGLRDVASHLVTRRGQARSMRRSAEQVQSERQHEVDDLSPTLGKLGAQVQQLETKIETATPELTNFQNQLPGRQAAAAAAQGVVDSMDLNDAQLAAVERGDELGAAADLEHRMDRAEHRVNDEERYPLHIRTEEVLSQRDEQREVVNRADDALRGVGTDMEGLRTDMERAREAYDANVNATIRLLNARFQEVCTSAGVVGEMRRIAGEGRGEYGLDVLAAHKPGEKPISYQKKNFHSGGQTVKIAILLLLAAMSMGDEGSAEMLIMDEPIAHMSVENADQIAEVIVSLKDKAQFILAMPTNAETLRVHWAEWQISLLGRRPGRARSDSPQILSNLDVDPEARFRSPQLALETA